MTEFTGRPGYPNYEVRAKNKQTLKGFRYLADTHLEAPLTRSVFDLKSMTLDPDEAGIYCLGIFASVPDKSMKRFYVDSYSRMETAGNFHGLNLLMPGFRNSFRRLLEHKKRFYDQFTKVKTDMRFMNPPRNVVEWLVPIFNRDHIKGCRRDQEVFYFGGYNIEDGTLESADAMVKFTGEMASKLADEFDRLHTNPDKDDRVVKLSDDTTLYIDAGIPGKSTILDKAVQIIQQAKTHAYNTSQFIPDGTIAEELDNAHKRGVDAEVVTHVPPAGGLLPLKWPQIMRALNLVNEAKLKMKHPDLPIKFNLFRIVHAKLLIADTPNGEVALFGTHNLADSGVKAGTREWAIVTYDPELIANLRTLYFDIRSETDPRLLEVLH